jgi:hypothetical protein
VYKSHTLISHTPMIHGRMMVRDGGESVGIGGVR